MQNLDRAQVSEILHDYKKECFQYQHSTEHDVVAREATRLVDEVLAQNFHFHVHKPLNPERAEILGMIENYTREAVLPPVVNKLAERVVLLEKRHEAAIKAMERLLQLIET